MRILWLKTELLHPIDKGGKIRTYFTLQQLVRHHRVTYLTLDPGDGAKDALARAGEYAHEVVRIPHVPARKLGPRFFLELMLNLASSVPYAVARYRSRPMERRIRALVASGGFDLLICDFLAPDVNVPRPLPVPTILFQHNVEARIWERHTEVQRSALRRAFFRSQWRKMKRYERAACGRYDHVIAVSEDDRDAMRSEYGAPNVDAVPTGVDTAFFSPSGKIGQIPGNVVFVGSMDWMPNEDAVAFFTADVWPAVREQVPEATLTVVGRKPGAAVRALDGKNGVEVTGRVDDVRPYLERAAVAVVPLRVGGGTRLKIYEAMAMGKPTVSTTIGAEGLPLTDGEEIHLADEPGDFAARVVDLLRDPAAAADMGATAQSRVRRDFSWESAARPFIEICERVAARSKRDLTGADTALTNRT